VEESFPELEHPLGEELEEEPEETGSAEEEKPEE
jgi:hypothetical protein